MTQEHYISEKASIKKQLEDLFLAEQVLKVKYIETNKRFEMGQKVKVFFKNGSELGFVTGFDINYQNEVEYVVNKIKKNGEMSQHKIWMYNVVFIEPA